MSKPFNRTFDLAAGTKLYEGVLQFNRMFTEAATVPERIALLQDPAFRDAIRDAVERPNRDPDAGPTLPPPHWFVLHVNEVSKPEHEKYVGRSLVDIAAELGVHPTDAMLDIAVAEELATEFVWRTETPEWIEGTRIAQDDPHMIVGTSDGGAHLDRDDGAEAGHLVPALLGEGVGRVHPRGGHPPDHGQSRPPSAGSSTAACVLPGYAADLFVFDPDTVGPDHKEFVHDFPERCRPLDVQARPECTRRSSTACPSSSTASSSPTPASPAPC